MSEKETRQIQICDDYATELKNVHITGPWSKFDEEKEI